MVFVGGDAVVHGRFHALNTAGPLQWELSATVQVY